MRLCAINVTRGTILAHRATRASTFLDRFLGWMGQGELPPGVGLHLVPCSSIHTFFMRLPIDVLFLDEAGRSVRVVEALAPWRTVMPVASAHSVLELPAGILRATGTRGGDQIRFDPAPLSPPFDEKIEP